MVGVGIRICITITDPDSGYYFVNNFENGHLNIFENWRFHIFQFFSLVRRTFYKLIKRWKTTYKIKKIKDDLLHFFKWLWHSEPCFLNRIWTFVKRLDWVRIRSFSGPQAHKMLKIAFYAAGHSRLEMFTNSLVAHSNTSRDTGREKPEKRKPCTWAPLILLVL
jgi:hypothetical protein